MKKYFLLLIINFAMFSFYASAQITFQAVDTSANANEIGPMSSTLTNDGGCVLCGYSYNPSMSVSVVYLSKFD